MSIRTLELSPDRLLPAEPGVRDIARRLYRHVAKAPIVSPHGHVDPVILRDDLPFANGAALLIAPDHYVTRLLHASGVPLSEVLGDADPRTAWRHFCAAWPVFAGTASGQWITAELVEVFGIDTEPSVESADALFDELTALLSRPQFRPRALFERFGIEVLATTDDPVDDLAVHADLARSLTTGRVVPTFRPDAYLDVSADGWRERVERLTGGAADIDSFLTALATRRAHFAAHGAVATDHSPAFPRAIRLASYESRDLHRRAMEGRADADERAAYSAGLLYEMARMSAHDGLVMTLHPGVVRNHHEPTRARFGPDTGHDIPRPVSFVDGLRPILEDFGTDEVFRLLLFTLDESTYSREIAPLAGFYPTVYIGAPWWFLDAPDAMNRFRAATTETSGFSRYSGFIDDTRGFCSIPARHDTARRVDAGFLARLVAEHRLTEERAADILDDSVGAQPRRVFRL